jgi:hypothetical protein
MDSDMIILDDLAKLWNNPWEPGAIIQCRGGWRMCVSKWNCEEARHVLPSSKFLKGDKYSHLKMMSEIQKYPELQQVFDRQWNNIDGENDPNLNDVKILHYSSMNHQPHLKYVMKRFQKSFYERKHWFDGEIMAHWRQDVIDLFDQYYAEALEYGYVVYDYIPHAADRVAYKKQSQINYKNAHEFVR